MTRPYAKNAERQEMSVSKYMYDPKYCDGNPCVGDCDLCSEWKKWDEIEDDGFVTPEWMMSTLERKSEDKAIPMQECRYPRCEECKDYVSRDGKWYCTVPMVISKQTWMLTTELIVDFNKRISDLEELVDYHMFRSETRTQHRDSEHRNDADLMVDGVD